MLISILAAASAFVAVTTAALLATNLRGSPVEARLSRIPSPSRPRDVNAPFGERVAIPFVDGVVRLIVQFLPPTWVSRISRQLSAAGQPMTTQAFITLLVMTGMLFPAAVLTFAAMTAGEVTPVAIVLALFVLAIGMMGPLVWLRAAARNRRLAIWKKLPDAFDLITVCVEAGLGLDAALRQVAEKLRGPISDEISQVLREVGMGRQRREALEDMARRTDVRELETFVNAVVQAEQLGTSLGRVLRAQAFSLRTKRRQRAQELARRAPVKMVFPLVLLIMPTFFIITVGPVFVHMVSYLSDK